MIFCVSVNFFIPLDELQQFAHFALVSGTRPERRETFGGKI